MEYRLGDIVKVNRGASPRPIMEYLDKKGYPWLKISDFKLGERYVYNTKEFIKKEGLTKTRLVTKGTLILTNSATPGIPIFLGKDMCLHDGFLYFSEINEKVIKKEYLYYWFLVNRDYIVNNANGSVFKNLKKEIVENLILELPKIKEQQKIVKILNNISKKIELNTQTNNNLLDISQNLYENYINTNKDIKYKKIRELNPILESGKRPNGGVSNIKEGIPSVGAENVKKIGYYDYSKTKYVTEEFFNKMKKGILKGYEVLIYKDGGKPGYFIPNFSIFGENFPFTKCAINEHVFLLDFNDIKYNCFAYYYFNSFKIRHKLHVLGSKSAAIPGINQQDVLDLEIPYSESEEFKNLSNILKLNTQKILKNSYQNRTLEQLRYILLPKLMNGEIELDKIEI